MNEQSIVELEQKSSMSEEDNLIIDTINKFLEKDVKPFVKEFESEDKYPQMIADKMAELGLFGATISPEYGGLGLSAVTYSKIVENVSAVWMSVSGIFNSHLIMCAAVERFGTEEMKKNYLPKFASGELRGGIALTEPDCGTDLQSIKTKAEKVDESYVINGTKTWITNSPIANILIIWAKDEQDILRGFIVERDTKGLSTPYLEGNFSLRASATGQIFLEDVYVEESKVLPEAQSFRAPFSCLNMARYGISWGVIGAAEYCWNAALEYSIDRIQFKAPLASKQLIQKKLADMQTEITIGLQGSLRVGRLIDEDEFEPEMISLIKRNNCSKSLDIARSSRDIFGGNGISDEYHVIRHCMNLEAVKTYEGTDDIHALILGNSQTGISAF